MRRGLNELSGRTSRIRRRRMDPQVATNKNAIAAEVLPANSPGPPRPYPGDLPEPKPAEPEIQPERRAGAHRAWGFLGGFLKTHRDFRICRQKPLRHFIPHRRALLRRLSPKTLRCDSTARSPLSDQPVDMPICVVHLRHAAPKSASVRTAQQAGRFCMACAWAKTEACRQRAGGILRDAWLPHSPVRVVGSMLLEIPVVLAVIARSPAFPLALAAFPKGTTKRSSRILQSEEFPR